MADAYYNPKDFGLMIVAHLSDPDACYDFDDLIVWKHESGTFYWAADSGCSCPSPFESYTSLESLNKLPETMAEFQATLRDHPAKPDEKVHALRSVLIA